MDFAKSYGYSVGLHDDFRRFLEDVPINEDIKSPFELRDYQEEAVNICLKKKRAIILSSTGSGKSLIIYNLVRSLQDKKILVITPRVSLVTQLFSDFEDYAEKDTWVPGDHCHMIYSGQDKDTDKEISITTWQSVYKLGKKFFEQFDVVIADEVHEFEGKSCSAIMNKCTNAFFRFGFTGTLKDSKTHELSLIGMFGPVKRVSSTKDLIDRSILSDVEIKCVVCKYPPEACKSFGKAKYQDEINFIIGHPKRNLLLRKIAEKAKGNVLLLVSRIEGHAKPLCQDFKKHITGREIFLITGGTDAEQREKVRKIMEARSDVIVIASMQLFSTGINIKNLPNIVFGHPTKSKTKILQSVGRGLRTHKDKAKCVVWDIGDDLRGTRKSANHTLNHFLSRYEIYVEEGFKVSIKNLRI